MANLNTKLADISAMLPRDSLRKDVTVGKRQYQVRCTTAEGWEAWRRDDGKYFSGAYPTGIRWLLKL